MDKDKVIKYLGVIKRAVLLLEAELDDVSAAAPVIQPTPIVQPIVNVEHVSLRKKHIDALMAIDCWPEAVKAAITTVTDKDQVDRANAVLATMISRSLEDVNFLDFGCGEGWIAQQVVSRGVRESHGYDIAESANWKNLTGVNFSNKFDDLPKSHFDIIMLYDVLDHCDNPIEVMAEVQKVLKPNGTVYVRCHPWTSMHATHVFKQGLNKAYIHLFLKPHEIAELTGSPVTYTRMEKDPITAYKWWFNNFEIQKESLKTERVSDFFQVPAFKELLANEQGVEINKFLELMKIQFADYQLVNKK